MDQGFTKRNALAFFLLVLLLSIPFWLLGALTKGSIEILPMQLPLSALMTFCPAMAALILIFREYRVNGVQELASRIFDFQRIKDWRWFFPILLIMPIIAVISYYWSKNANEGNANTEFSVLVLFASFIAFFVGAIGEELGWSGYASEPLQERFGAFYGSLIIGVVWAIWHLIPFMQMQKTLEWIFWQSLSTIFLRTIIVWLFNNTNQSVFVTILFHTLINLSPYLIPGNGVHYNPFILAISSAVIALTVACVCRVESLSKGKRVL